MDKNEKVKRETNNAIDSLSKECKNSGRKIFDACTENTSEIISLLFDKGIEKLKDIINKKVK